MSRHLMTPDPEAPPIRLATMLWIIVFVVAIVCVLGAHA